MEAEAPSCCPDRGGSREQIGEEQAERPKLPTPQITAYSVAVCRCRASGRKVRGAAPGLAADQHGATVHRFGPTVMAAAAQRPHYGRGIPQRKLPTVLSELTGVRITQSALAQDASRRGKGNAGAEHPGLRASVKDSAFVRPNDTGWRDGGQGRLL